MRTPSVRTALITQSSADHPRFLESVVGRLLELVVYSVEGIRERFGRRTSAIH
jgi:hypothetical protein